MMLDDNESNTNEELYMDLTLLARAIAVIGAGLGAAGGGVVIGLIGAKVLEAMARQSEEKKNIRTNMILMAALVEGLTFFSAVIALLIIFMK
jgi:F-type H+-transporting ATPase subunit c